VCLCNGHTADQLEALASSGVKCVEKAYEILGGSPACRRCIDMAQDVLNGAGTDRPSKPVSGTTSSFQKEAAQAP
ncbi:MAG: hypothetical protein OXD42_10745, partial [Rhodospirillaceae bacterium]|nr:hypothetical protein [Rhodospirillaceae bacterium]